MEFKKRILNWNHENNGKIDIDFVFNKLDSLYDNDDSKIKYDDFDALFMELFKSEVVCDVANNFRLYFESQDVTYSPITDSLNMVIDRDKENFFDDQYDKVRTFCKNNNVNLYVSNPNFEFWLFLHFPAVELEDRYELLLNKKCGKRRYIEKRLNEIFGYNKRTFNFNVLEDKIYDAIKREKNYEESLDGLKENLGTNVGLLVNKIILTGKTK